MAYFHEHFPKNYSVTQCDLRNALSWLPFFDCLTYINKSFNNGTCIYIGKLVVKRGILLTLVFLVLSCFSFSSSFFSAAVQKRNLV